MVIIGCGCGSKKIGATAPTLSNNRFTVYQVLVGSDLVKEFDNLREARAEAVVVGGRVKVTSKTK